MLVSYLLLIVSCRSSIVVFVTGRESPLVGAIGLYPGLLFYIVIGFWQIGGVWRSAKRRGGFWAKPANFGIVWVVLGLMSNFTANVKHQQSLAKNI